MKALRILQWGAPVQLEEIPVPKIAPDEMLVRVHAASLNPADLAVVTGYFQNMLTVPMTPGSDFAGEFAKEQGAEVIGIASAKDIPFLQQDLGLDQVVEYQAFEQMVADVDVVLNTANHDFSTRAYNVLKPGGRLVSIVGQPPEEAAERLGIYATMHYAGPSSDQLT